MMKESTDELDLNKLQNVSFLADCFDNSFTFRNSLNYVKDYVAKTKSEDNEQKFLSKKKNDLTQSQQNYRFDNVSLLMQENHKIYNKSLKNWGLPLEITKKYEQRGIVEMFDWQVDCLSKPNVLMEYRNLVYSAPTSAGKTLVAEILTIKTVLERQKKVIIILPFVSIVREKMYYLQEILSSSGVRVEGFMGSQSPPGGLQAVHIAICTIEKANSLVNKLLDEGNIEDLGAVIVDELHLLGDHHRGYILELLLTKIIYVCNKMDNIKIQIVGMSATLPNLEILADWLSAELFVTEFRPIPLDEYCLVGNQYYDKTGKLVGVFNKNQIFKGEGDNILSLCLETIKGGCSILIFCMTKNNCENLAQSISSSFFKIGCANDEGGLVLREQLNSEKILQVLEQLKNCPVRLDKVLKNIISFGVAYHHAGLTFDERDIIEGAFKSGAIRVLVATSTLSSGVNLPARKVIIRSPVFQRQPINILTYKQMIGRAGRMGKDSKGESVLICSPGEQNIGFKLMMGNLDPIKSCIESEDKFMRAILEMIASQDVSTKSELDLYTKCTLLFTQLTEIPSQNILLENTLRELVNYELIRIQTEGDEKRYAATSLGKACLSSSMAPNDGLSLFCELQKARECLVLESDLHLIYLVTPYSVSNQWNNIDWLHLLNLWESLTTAMKRVGELVGVQESFIIRCLRGTNKSNAVQSKLNIHKRFYTALALQDLVNEVPLYEVAFKFQCARGFLQGLQQASATFAGMVTAFCRQLGWKNMELLVSQFQDRLQFGIHSELLELMKLPSLNGMRARTLFDAGFQTIANVASADVNIIESTLLKSIPFQSEKEREGDDDIDVRKRNKIKNFWITGCCGMTSKEAAENLILEARNYLAQEIGVTEIKWKDMKCDKLYVDDNNDHKSDTFIDTKREIQNDLKDQPMINEKNSQTECLLRNLSTNKEFENEDVIIDVSLTPTKNTNLKEISTRKQPDEKYILTQYIENEVSINKNIEQLSINQDKDLTWESLNFADASLYNLSKDHRTSDNLFSPNMSIHESSHKDENVNNMPKNTSVKDVSLFSSEDETSSIFGDSLPIDLLPNTLIDGNLKEEEIKVHCDKEKNIDYFDLNSNTILNAFKSSLIDIDEDKDENLKLIYDDTKLNISQENEILNTQEFKQTSVKHSFISPLKRHAHSKNGSLAKKLRKQSIITNTFSVQITCSKSQKIRLQVGEKQFDCYFLREHDITKNLSYLENLDNLSIMLDTKTKKCKSSEVIGRNILKQGNAVSEDIQNIENCLIRGIALCLNSNLCLYLDLASLGTLTATFKLLFSRFISNPLVKLSMFSVQFNCVHLKKWLGKNLGTECIDVALMEWLLDCDEKISKIIDLAKKYCNIDFTNVRIRVGNINKSYNNLENAEMTSVKAWCVSKISEEQTKLPGYQFMYKILDIETQVSKLLGDCEYYGIFVDKDLASKLLIDVKNSQEVLQKKAFKLCGYHFNFNSSKDVAKVLGLYRGRKISTKKSVLSAHNSPMASIVIYWRKLNSILTKTLYPLTEKAFTYSNENRISPFYTMYTCTGRISMHEPNLQNVPRTFSIPFKYLSMRDSEICDDVIEFNCRNIFKAAPGYIFVSADYCQLEMRILTHYSKDEVLTKIMSSNEDVFKSIAASWSGVPQHDVDDDLRQKAKQLCYGILYGMGNRTLAQHLDVNEIEAAMFMDTFYKSYPSIKTFTQKIVEDCRKNGYVETLMKRRRYLPDITSTVGSKRSTAERQAVNTTIQGSAADIAKAAMCAIDNKTNLHADKPRLILQMHDELIYEVIESQKSGFVKILKTLMQDTVRLNVPLPVKVKIGYTWGGMEEMKL